MDCVMYEISDKSNPAKASYFVHGYAPWAPSGLVGRTSPGGIVSLVLGILALAGAITSMLTGLAWLAAIFGVAAGLLVVLPRASGAQKVASGIGVVASVAAVVLLLG